MRRENAYANYNGERQKTSWMSYGCCCDGHNIQSVMEHIDNRTAHLNRSFLLKTKDDVIIVITVSVKKK